MKKFRFSDAFGLGLTLLLLATPPAFAETRTKPKPAPQSSASSSVAWDSWYTVTLNKTTPAQYFNEKVEQKQEKIHVQQNVWKKEEGYINEESLGSFSANSPEMTPLFFNFRSSYRSTETTVDGTIENGFISIRMKSGGQDRPILKRTLGKSVILESFFPLWAGSKIGQMRVGQIASFTTLPENGSDPNFMLITGNIRLEAPDDFAKKTNTSKVLVEYRGVKTTWWMEKSGQSVRIEMPAQNAVVERVTREVAQKFLN